VGAIELDYQTYLQTTRWRLIREEVLCRDGYRCVICYSNKNLNCHHRCYDRIGDEQFGDVYTLCADCHELFHKAGKLRK
jgi:5-methylcytosine-specific restriction endonuclease McrA